METGRDQNKKLVEAEEVELRCEDCKKDFNSEYNLHIHLESEGHRTRVAAIKRLYLEPKPEKQPTEQKPRTNKGADETRVANEREKSSPAKQVYQPKQKPQISSE